MNFDCMRKIHLVFVDDDEEEKQHKRDCTNCVNKKKLFMQIVKINDLCFWKIESNRYGPKSEIQKFFVYLDCNSFLSHSHVSTE